MMAARPAGSFMVDISPLRESPVFRRLFIGRTILLVGVGMVAVTVPVHVFLQTGSTVQVGTVTSVEGIAFLFGFLFAGMLTDRFDRWRILEFARLGTVASFIGLTVNAALAGPVWAIALLVAVNGLAGATAITALLAVLPSLVGRSKLHAVGALNTLSLRLGTVLAPVAGGAVAAAAGPVWSYGVGAAAALLTVPMLRRPYAAELPDRPESPAAEPGSAAESGSAGAPGRAGESGPVTPREHPLRALAGGYGFILRERVVFGVMAAGVVGMLGGGSRVLLPALAETRFGNAQFTVGLMYSAVSAGLVAGAVTSGWIRRVARPGLLLLLMMVLCFLCWAAAGVAPLLWLALAALLAAGAVNSVEEVLRYALLQQRTPEEYLGRVNSVFAAQNMSGIAVGAMIAGFVGAWLDPVTAFWGYNVAMAGISVVVLFLLPALRRHRGEDARSAGAEESEPARSGGESEPARPGEGSTECAGQ
jgi:ENTS family enterobactin (siderophore) exporter